jgi:hypothetical protein
MIIQEELTRGDGTKFSANRNGIAKEEWRLVYSNGKVKDFFESGGYTWTINNLFCGTEKECLGEIDKLHLKCEDINAKI